MCLINTFCSAEPYSAPNDVQLVSITSEGLTFNWTSVDPTCSAVSYGVSATDCGNYPSSTNLTTIVCSGIQLSGETQTCTLSVQSFVCGDITSNFSDPLNISLQGILKLISKLDLMIGDSIILNYNTATTIPRANILPRYWQNTSNLAVLGVEIPIVR